MISTLTKPGEAEVADKSFFYAVHDISRLLRRRFDEAAHMHDLTMPQWRVVAQLAREEGISQVKLAALIDAKPMTVSGLVERLEAKGLVVREPDPSDSRAKIVRITDQARALISEVKIVAEDMYAEAFQGIDAAERAQTLDVLTRVNANLSMLATFEELAE